jgi:hypothetical protein
VRKKEEKMNHSVTCGSIIREIKRMYFSLAGAIVAKTRKYVSSISYSKF